MKQLSVIILFGLTWVLAQPNIRMNQLGFEPKEVKTALILSNENLSNVEFRIIDCITKRIALSGPLWSLERTYGKFNYLYRVNISSLRKEGSYAMIVGQSDSMFFGINKNIYSEYLNYPLHYLLTQRCGENPILGKLCHQLDAIAVDGHDRGMPIDLIGGYHENSTYTKFLGTTSYSIGILLMTYRDYPMLWIDSLDGHGKSKPNKIPDILDEVRWGLEWMLKMYHQTGDLYFQVGDDRGNIQNVAPFKDSSDYGWGKGRQRPAYFATGQPQGLFTIKNSSSGITNIAGRTAAVFALASWIWKNEKYDHAFAEKLLLKASDLYELAKSNLGALESVPCKTQQRYEEKNIYDDLEWAAAELYHATGKKVYLDEGMAFSEKAADESWMGADTIKHYEYFPFVNLGHYELYIYSNSDVKRKLRDYFRSELMRAYKSAQDNVFNYGVPFVRTSNNLAVGLVTQIILYKKMGGSKVFDEMLRDTRDYLFGKNPWNKSFIIGIPKNGRYQNNPYSSIEQNSTTNLAGGLVSGPVRKTIWNSESGLDLKESDSFSQFQSNSCVYTDDNFDNVTNEPTLDGTAALIYVLAYYSQVFQADSD